MAPGLARVVWGQVLQQQTVIRDLKRFLFGPLEPNRGKQCRCLRLSVLQLIAHSVHPTRRQRVAQEAANAEDAGGLGLRGYQLRKALRRQSLWQLLKP